MEEYLVPYLAIGGNRETFFKLTPKTIQYDFKAYKIKQQNKNQFAWLVGAYVKSALQSTVIMASLADRSAANKMPKYAEQPTFEKEDETDKMSKQDRTKYWVAKMDRLTKYINSKNKGG